MRVDELLTPAMLEIKRQLNAPAAVLDLKQQCASGEALERLAVNTARELAPMLDQLTAALADLRRHVAQSVPATWWRG